MQPQLLNPWKTLSPPLFVMKVRPEMQALRTFYAQKHLLTLTPHKLASRPSLFSSRISPNPNFPLHFQSTPQKFIHSTNHRPSKEATSIVDDIKGWTSSSSRLNTFGSENGKNPNVSATYDPTTGGLVPKIGTNYNNDEQGSIPSNGYDNSPRLPSSDEEGDSKKDRSFGKGISTSGAGFRGGGSRKKEKNRTHWVCSDCGYSDGQWWGTCRSCESVGTMKQFSLGEYGGGGKTSRVSETVVRSWLPQQSVESSPLRLTDVKKGMKTDWRFPLSGLLGNEVARVLGGGLVPGSLVLVGGDPGVGKSTLMLQIAAIIAEGHDTGEPSPVVYISGEESVEQIGNRADRMRIVTEELFLYSSTDVEDILEKSQLLSPRALIVDSIQTVYLRGVVGNAGGLSQVKECTSALLHFAKKTNIPILLTGHVNKTGEIAGPRVLEHIVDVVLYMEGEKSSSHRLLRTVKNRFGSTDELGILEMSQSGLQAVSNPSEIFLSEQHPDSEFLAGLAVTVTMEGSRSFVIEIQALCLACSSASRQVNGVPPGRANMIISVLMKQAGLKLQESGVFINVVSGYNLTETAGDLAVAAAICSSFLEFPIPNGVAFIGEIGLAGELRAVSRMEKRVNTVAKMGYRMCIVPKSAVKSLSAALAQEKMEILGCQNLKEVINTVFTTP